MDFLTATLPDGELTYARTGHGRPCLLIHGFPLDHTMWQGQLNGLSSTFDLIAPDLRGFGHSKRLVQDAAPLTMEQHADDLNQLLDVLGIQDPITICGLSMGGYIAFQFWARNRARVGRMILCDTKAAADSDEAVATRHATADRVLQEGADFLAETMAEKLFAESTRQQQSQVVSATQQVIRQTPSETIAGALLGMACREDATPLLSQIMVPVQLICGQEDSITPVEEMATLAQLLPNARMAIVPDAGHMAPLEQPDRVNRVLMEFGVDG